MRFKEENFFFSITVGHIMCLHMPWVPWSTIDTNCKRLSVTVICPCQCRYHPKHLNSSLSFWKLMTMDFHKVVFLQFFTMLNKFSVFFCHATTFFVNKYFHVIHFDYVICFYNTMSYFLYCSHFLITVGTCFCYVLKYLLALK